MNVENLIIILLSAVIFILLLGMYKTTLGRKESAKEKIKSLLGNEKETDPKVFRQQQEVVLKRRKAGSDTFGAKLETDLERANLLLRGGEFLMVCVGSSFLTFLVTMFLFAVPLPLAMLFGLLGSGLPFLFLKIKIAMRMAKADAEFSDILDALVNCFKTGYGFSRAVQVIAENYDDPWGTEFAKMSMEMSLGSTQEDVLYGLTRRIPSPDVDLFVTGMIIQKETGGNMAELLSSLSNTIRERYKLYRKVTAISAQGKLSAGIICCIPPGLMGLMYLVMPKAVEDFVTNPIGMILLIVAGVWMVIGIGVLYKMVQVEV
jgi:tight adherence protein B